MIFNKDSGLVKIWIDNVQHGIYTLDQIPILFNLKDVVVNMI